MAEQEIKMPEALDELSSQKHNDESSILQRAIVAGEVAVIAAEVTPANEAFRLMVAGTAQAINGDPVVVASAFAGATLVVEGIAAYATADLLDRPTGRKAINWVNKKMKRVTKQETVSTNLALEASLAYLGGTAITTFAKASSEPERTKQENKQYGLMTSLGLATVCGLQAYMLSRGIETPDAKNIAAAVFGVASVPIVAGMAKRRFGREDSIDQLGVSQDD
ncbi:hypothetical protein KC951_01415 [Candidatus Saccharibacteria bacterium]|nr:hypothetical protein [Candidatus Saccharibacteria bacterium]